MPPVDQHLLLRALVDEFARGGMRVAVTAAGSRNTPIIEALVAEPRLRSFSHIDERSAGFFAIGAARAGGAPVAVTATSGTAVANLLPAVVEASEAGLALIVLSADRPAELRGIGAGQTIDQVKLFGPYVRLFTEPDLDQATPERMRWLRALACRAMQVAQGPDPGPVHINLPLREPLVLETSLPEDPMGGEGRPDGRPWTATARPSAPAEFRAAVPSGSRATIRSAPEPELGSVAVSEPGTVAPPASARRTVIVAGDFGTDPAAGAALALAATQQGLPLLADPLSQARRGRAAIPHYDLILRDPFTAERLAPELVIRVGDTPTSKPLRTWLAALEEAEQVLLHPRPVWADPVSRIARREVLTPAEIVARIRTLEAPGGWLGEWQAAEAAVAAGLPAPDAEPALSEPAVATLLGQELPPEAILYVAASMPIRDVEEFLPARDNAPRVLANRGANGIDGTVSAAFGAAAVNNGPVVLLIGDVALAHDIGGLLTARRGGLALTIVLINNDGGGIFNFLRIAEHPAAFNDHVATPHGLEFVHAAALYGLDHVAVTDAGGLRAALQRSLHAGHTTLLEVRTDRVANRLRHAEIERTALDALGALSA
ncbi:MAG TPA: 2-succinyl-5-enolpyruvyl-6-hydroxy-3-cyclohexene-1-carboxylic-acid synthase [Solirubrobacteraceae bacterium]|nr:2-succinyl-5-enolpyruvyl-6-hydroxy-3-cyclohexene-1-carboxylic-acid synthase [Solirubrobacteraceae bacterium]